MCCRTSELVSLTSFIDRGPYRITSSRITCEEDITFHHRVYTPSYDFCPVNKAMTCPWKGTGLQLPSSQNEGQ